MYYWLLLYNNNIHYYYNNTTVIVWAIILYSIKQMFIFLEYQMYFIEH